MSHEHPYQHFCDQFWEWEQLGRGSLPASEYPISLEPPYRPFPGYRRPALQSNDDGTRPTWLTRAINSFRAPEQATIDSDEPTPLEFDFFERDSVVEVAVWLPESYSPALAAAETCLAQLQQCSEPLALELFGNCQGVKLQFVASCDDAASLTRVLKTYFPDAVFRPDPDALLSAFNASQPAEAAILDFALGREYLFPLATPPMDPFVGLVGALADLPEEQFGVYQVLFQPVRHPWADSCVSALLDEQSQPFPWIDPHLAQTGIKKAEQPLFATTVRLCAAANDIDEVSQTLVGLASTLNQYGNHDGNCLIPLEPEDDYQPDSQLFDLLRRQSRRFGMLLSLRELLGLVHLPGPEVSHPCFVRQLARTNAAPSDQIGLSLHLGTNEHHGEARAVHLSNDDRTRHMHVLGASGTGKSTFLLNCILQDIDQGQGCALLDPHGDLVEAVLAHLPEHRIQDVIVFDPADEEYPVGFNMLSARSEVEKNLLASDFVSIFRRLSSAWGDQMTAVLGNATLAILESSEGGTLLELRRFLVEAPFRQKFLQTVQDPEVRYFWQHEFPLMRGNTQISLLTRLNAFIRQKLIRNMIGQPRSNLDFARIMDERKIFLAPLSQGLIGEDNSWLLGSLLVSKFYQIALARQTQSQTERQPFWLYIDEAHNFITDSIASILSGTRKYGLGLVLSHQELGQFDRGETGILSSILTNAHTRVCFRVGDQDARKLQEGFQHFEAEDLRQLDAGEAICRIGGSDSDFNLIAPPPPDTDARSTSEQEARSHSRSNYATPKAEVEAAINAGIAARAEALEREAEIKRARKAAKSRVDERETTKSSPSVAELITERPPLPKPPGKPLEKESPTPPETPQNPKTSPSPKEPITQGPEGAEEDSEAQNAAEPEQKRPGRGGAKHKTLQEEIKVHGNDIGLTATIEAELPDKSGSVDVLLEGQSVKIAIEVALGSPIKQEIRNIEKSLTAGVSSILVVSDNSTHLRNIEQAARDAGLELENKVRFLADSELADYFSELGSTLASHETESRGYQVSVSYAKLDPKERKTRKAAIHRAVAETIRQMKQKGSDSAET